MDVTLCLPGHPPCLFPSVLQEGNLLFSIVESHILLFIHFRNHRFGNRHFGCKDNNITRFTQMFSAKFSENAKISSENTSDYTSLRLTPTVLPKHFPRPTQGDGKPKQLAWACEVLANSLPRACQRYVLPKVCLSVSSSHQSYGSGLRSFICNLPNISSFIQLFYAIGRTLSPCPPILTWQN